MDGNGFKGPLKAALKDAFDAAGQDARRNDPNWHDGKEYEAVIYVTVKDNPGIKEYRVELKP